jgi:hypothetical protein
MNGHNQGVAEGNIYRNPNEVAHVKMMPIFSENKEQGRE